MQEATKTTDVKRIFNSVVSCQGKGCQKRAIFELPQTGKVGKAGTLFLCQACLDKKTVPEK